VSHDLRTPLATITGSATTLRESPDMAPAARRDLVEAICEEAERLERLVSNLLDMTRLDSGAVEPKREWVPLDEVVGGALTRLERTLAGRRVTTTIPADVPLVALDPVLVQQLFVNLLENAAKYTPPGSEIEIRAGREGGTLVVEVADRGPGIPLGDEERVFERFHRGPHAGVRGVGLGLPIARAIAQAHGGRLVAASRPGGGAAFRLTLPIGAEPPTSPPEGGAP
jgi:two-component system sensor histidine kinase KdpD